MNGLHSSTPGHAAHHRAAPASKSTAVVLTLLLAFLTLSLPSSSSARVNTDTPAVAVQIFDTVPDDALTPEPVNRSVSRKQAEAALPPPVPTAIQAPQASPPQRIEYQATGIDVAVYPMEIDQASRETQSLVPPFTLDGYWLSSFGTPGYGSTNTTYVIGHSWEDRDAPFNRLSSGATPGETFTVTTATGVLTYRVDSVTTFLKSTLKDSDIWRILPNRLVLISCYTEDLWGKNVVVVASPVP